MKGLLAFFGLAVMVVSESSDAWTDDLEAELRLLRAEVEELRSVAIALMKDDDPTYSDSPSEAAPGRRRLQTSGGGGETASISFDGMSLKIQSTATGKSTKVAVLGDLNITGDIYLNGALVRGPTTPEPTTTPAPTPTPTCSGGGSPFVMADASWIGDTTDYSSTFHQTYPPSTTLDGIIAANTGWLGYASNDENWLIYDLGSNRYINGVQIGNGQTTSGVQETLLQSGTSMSGPWTTEATFTVTNSDNGGGTDYILTDYARGASFNTQYLRLWFNSNYGATDFYKVVEFAVYTC